MDKKVVGVTGAGGMIGKVVVEVLKKRGYVVKTDRIEVANDAEVKEFMAGCDYFIHLAVEMDMSKGKEVFWRTNVKGVKNVLKNVNKNIKTVMVSSVIVYKENSEVVRDKLTGNYYIDTKVEGLKLIRKSKNKVVTVMPSAVLDKSTFEIEKHFENKFIDWIYNSIGGGIPGGIMSAVGKRNRRINVVEVSDEAEGIVLAMEKGKLGEEYILAGENISVDDYLKRIAKQCHKKYLNVRIPYFIVNFYNIFAGKKIIIKPEDVNFSSEKAVSELGYKINWRP